MVELKMTNHPRGLLQNSSGSNPDTWSTLCSLSQRCQGEIRETIRESIGETSICEIKIMIA